MPIRYDDPAELEVTLTRLRSMPPLVTSWEIERLKREIADAQAGRRFLLQGGDCAESLADCRPDVIAAKLKILLQMSLVLVQGALKPVIRVGRFAGQYAKPRSSPVERRVDASGERELPSYFGDLINRADFDDDSRRPDPGLMLAGYQHAAVTLNFIRSLSEGGFADLHHPEYWDLSFMHRAGIAPHLKEEYTRLTEQVADAVRFMEALGEGAVEDLSRVRFYTSHEGLNLYYESAQTRSVPRRDGHYDLTTHLPWIGERTRQPNGAHVEFFRGVENPVGLKLGPSAPPDEVVELCRRLNSRNEPGKLLLIARMGATHVETRLPPLIDAVSEAQQRVLWVCDPMHGNTRTTSAGVKTRRFDDILAELEQTFDVHAAKGSFLGGVHFELTGEDVTECVGAGIEESDLDRRYASLCDPRLNYGQALELAFRITKHLRAATRR
jgi:3-deoxy-7-phosphoheptulonate synthase